MLVRNGRSIFQNPGRFVGVFSHQAGNFHKAVFVNRMVGGFSPVFGGYSNGKLAPNSVGLPIQPGSMSSYTEASGVITGSFTAVPAMPMQASSSLSISGTAALDRIVPLQASTSSNISGSASIAAAVALASSASGSISSSATLGGVFDISASGTTSMSGSPVLTAKAFIIAEAGGPTPLSPEGLASAVWSAAITDNTESGTMGSLLLASGGGSSPEVIASAVWDELMTTHNVSGSYGERMEKLLTLAKFLALK